MRVRLAGEGDVAAIAGLTNWAIRETVAHFGVAEQPASETLAEWRRWRERYPWLIAEEKGPDGARFLGFARGGVWQAREAYDWCCQTAVYVEPAAQARGVGRALYEGLFEMLRAQGFCTLVAGVTLPNEASVRLHERMGMRQVALFASVGFKFGRWLDVGYWQLDLRARCGGAPEPVRAVAALGAPGVS